MFYIKLRGLEDFEIKIAARWADVDQNRHIRHSAYYDYGAHSRIRFFLAHHFDSDKMNTLNIGPILFKEECSFIKELKPDQQITINLLRGVIKEDGSRWTLHHEIFDQNQEKCAHITIQGAWMDLKLRKLTVPPIELAHAFRSLPEGEPFTYRKKV